MTVTLALLLLGGFLEWRLLRAGVPAYFRWGLLCYAAQVYPEDTSEPDEDDPAEQARRQRRLIERIDRSWTRADAGERWVRREAGPGVWTLRPRFPNPLLVRARVELVDGGVHVQALLPWSFLVLPMVLVFAAAQVPVGYLVAAAVGVVAAAVFALRELDRLLYRGLEPLLAGR